MITNVSQPIIGTDFLNEFKLIVDISSKSIIDKVTNLSTNGSLTLYKGLPGVYKGQAITHR